MGEVPPNGERLLTTLRNALSNAWRQLVVIAIAVVAALILVVVLIEWRLTRDVPSSALTPSLPLALGVALLTLASLAITAALAWLVAALYQLFRKK